MAEAPARMALPRLRAAWLREMGVEILWPASARPVSSPVSPSVPEDEGMHRIEASAVTLPADPSLEALSQSPLPATDLMPGQDVAPTVREGAGRVAEPIDAIWQDGTAMLQCRVYAGDAPSAGGRWIVVADAAELQASREGPVRFVDALVQAVAPGARGSATAIPAQQESAVGWLADDGDFARLATEGARLILIGIAARRAAGMPTRLGEIGRLQVGARQLPAVALPLLSDLTASPTGKAEAWRVLRALASADN